MAKTTSVSDRNTIFTYLVVPQILSEVTNISVFLFTGLKSLFD